MSSFWESGMRRFAAGSLLAVALLLAAALPSDAGNGGGHGGGRHGGHHYHHHFGGRPHVFIGPRLLPVYPYWWDYPSYYYYAPPIVVQEPPVYIQPQPAPPASSRQDVPWYYCPSAKAYYPWVRTCPEVWVEVPPRPP
ncbi:MAG TPA: hypothetical protein VKD46_05830 [bacterium]|nr:hypothetical protein [bacterium]